MVEISPVELLGEHEVVGFVVSQFGESGLQQIDEPPDKKTDGYAFIDQCLHIRAVFHNLYD